GPVDYDFSEIVLVVFSGACRIHAGGALVGVEQPKEPGATFQKSGPVCDSGGDGSPDGASAVARIAQGGVLQRMGRQEGRSFQSPNPSGSGRIAFVIFTVRRRDARSHRTKLSGGFEIKGLP